MASSFGSFGKSSFGSGKSGSSFSGGGMKMKNNYAIGERQRYMSMLAQAQQKKLIKPDKGVLHDITEFGKGGLHALNTVGTAAQEYATALATGNNIVFAPGSAEAEKNLPSNRLGLHGIPGLAADIVLDPLNIVPFAGEANIAAKIGKAGLEAGKLAEEGALKAGKSAEEAAKIGADAHKAHIQQAIKAQTGGKVSIKTPKPETSVINSSKEDILKNINSKPQKQLDESNKIINQHTAEEFKPTSAKVDVPDVHIAIDKQGKKIVTPTTKTVVRGYVRPKDVRTDMAPYRNLQEAQNHTEKLANQLVDQHNHVNSIQEMVGTHNHTNLSAALTAQEKQASRELAASEKELEMQRTNVINTDKSIKPIEDALASGNYDDAINALRTHRDFAGQQLEPLKNARSVAAKEWDADTAKYATVTDRIDNHPNTNLIKNLTDEKNVLENRIKMSAPGPQQAADKSRLAQLDEAINKASSDKQYAKLLSRKDNLSKNLVNHQRKWNKADKAVEGTIKNHEAVQQTVLNMNSQNSEKILKQQLKELKKRQKYERKPFSQHQAQVQAKKTFHEHATKQIERLGNGKTNDLLKEARSAGSKEITRLEQELQKAQAGVAAHSLNIDAAQIYDSAKSITRKDLNKAIKTKEKAASAINSGADAKTAENIGNVAEDVSSALKTAETAGDTMRLRQLFPFGKTPFSKNNKLYKSGLTWEVGAPTQKIGEYAAKGEGITHKLAGVTHGALDSKAVKTLAKVFNADAGKLKGLNAGQKAVHRLSEHETEQIRRHLNEFAKTNKVSHDDLQHIDNALFTAQHTPIKLGEKGHEAATYEKRLETVTQRLEQLKKSEELSKKLKTPFSMAERSEMKALKEEYTNLPSMIASAKAFENLSDGGKKYALELQRVLTERLGIEKAVNLPVGTVQNYVPEVMDQGTGYGATKVSPNSDPFFLKQKGKRLTTEAPEGWKATDAVLRRVSASNLAVRQKVWSDELAKQIGLSKEAFDALPDAQKAGMTLIEANKGRSLLQGLSGKYVPNDVAEHINRLEELYADPATWKEVQNTFARATRAWKGVVYTYSLGHFYTDFTGNIAQMMYHNPQAALRMHKHWPLAVKIAKALNDPKAYTESGAKLAKLLPDTIDVAGNKMSRDDFMRMLVTNGIADSGYGAGEVGIRKVTNKANALAAKVQRAGNFNDNLTRIAGFLGSAETQPKGLELNQIIHNAADDVHKSMFDYTHGLSATEKQKLRNLFPFYSYLRFSLPLLAGASIKHTSTVEAYSRFQNMMMEDGNGGTKLPTDILPGYAQGSFLADKVPGIGKISPLSPTNAMFINPKLPDNGLNMIEPGSLSGTAGNFLGALNPALKFAPEIAMGKTFSGMPIDNKADYAIRQFGGGYGSLAGNSGLVPGSDQAGGKMVDNLFGLFTGIRPIHLNPQKLAAAAEYKVKEDERKQIAKLKKDKKVVNYQKPPKNAPGAQYIKGYGSIIKGGN